MDLILVCSLYDPISAQASSIIKSMLQFQEGRRAQGSVSYTLAQEQEGQKNANTVQLLEFNKRIVDIDSIDSLSADLIVFISRHASKSRINIFSVHALGNWSGEALLGGAPSQISVSSPYNMRRMLILLKKRNTTGIDVVYEATHHGPLLRTPSFFVEFGGDPESAGNEQCIRILAESVAEFAESFASGANAADRDGKVAVGIGGGHYAKKFTELALSGDYAFSHIMPKHSAGELDMVSQAISKSDVMADIAVLEWKSLNSFQRKGLIEKLSELGLGYEKI
ncbi:MAG: hypothetical protein M1331_02055 [Candidatus Marsarchaeota archaeon]|nr:hypothetical protein [Candidatus Marsarchaeota archaeon]MCL5106159.1 hypothetical protein [Candidatus Marsarchaeota archaeon]